MKTKRPIHSGWEKNVDGGWSTMHFTDHEEAADLDKDMMIRHCFFEVLDLLGIIEYDRGYDGLYYMVSIRNKK